jgi:hypothetical protein
VSAITELRDRQTPTGGEIPGSGHSGRWRSARRLLVPTCRVEAASLRSSPCASRPPDPRVRLLYGRHRLAAAAAGAVPVSNWTPAASTGRRDCQPGWHRPPNRPATSCWHWRGGIDGCGSYLGDRDAKLSHAFDDAFGSEDAEVICTPVWASTANACTERVTGDPIACSVGSADASVDPAPSRAGVVVCGFCSPGDAVVLCDGWRGRRTGPAGRAGRIALRRQIQLACDADPRTVNDLAHQASWPRPACRVPMVVDHLGARRSRKAATPSRNWSLS